MPRNIADPITTDADLHAFEEALKALPSTVYYDIWRLARSTGCRIGDLLGIKFMDVTAQGRWQFKPQKQKEKRSQGVLDAKRDKIRRDAETQQWSERKLLQALEALNKPLPTRLVRKTINSDGREIIRNRTAVARESQIYLFESPRCRGKPYTRMAIWKYWKKAAADAGLDINVATHTGRKTAGVMTYKLTSGDIARVGNLLYQKDLGSISAYLGMTDEDADSISEALG